MARTCRNVARYSCWFCCLCCPCYLLTPALAADLPITIHPDHPNAVTFSGEEARFVRFVIAPGGSSSSEPCIDELEVYGPAGAANLALAAGGARATASSCLGSRPTLKTRSCIHAGQSGSGAGGARPP